MSFDAETHTAPNAALLDHMPDVRNHKGFRIARIELRNFGGYHGSTKVFDFDCAGAVFSGDNGVGKSTVLDAFRVMFVSHPSFNSAAPDADKDRNVESYCLGHTGKTEDAATGRLRKNALRRPGDPSSCTSILVVFRSGDGVVFSALRMIYFRKAGERAEWRNITAGADISLDRDFPAWESPGRMSRKAAALDGTLHETHEKYFSAVSSRFGFTSMQEGSIAFRLLDKAIGAKKLPSTTAFARDFILPVSDLGDTADAVIDKYDAGREQRLEAARCRERISELERMEQHFSKRAAAMASRDQARAMQERIDQGRLFCERILFRGAVVKRRLELDSLSSVLARLETRSVEIEDGIARAQELLLEKGGDRLPALRAREQTLEGMVSSVAAKADEIASLAGAVGVKVDDGSAAGWAKSRELVEARQLELDADWQERQEEKVKLQVDARDANQEALRLGEELAQVDRNKSALPPKLVAARNLIAEACGRGAEDMPFLGELVDVREGEEAWEGVANRVLSGLGTQILVHPDDFDAANKAMNEARHFGARVRLVRADQASKDRPLDQRALARKLKIRDDSAFADVARSMVEGAAPHICCTDAEYARARGYAVTERGSVRTPGKAERNDLRRIDDRSSYVLGWSHEGRRAVLAAALDEADAKARRARDLVDQATAGIMTIGSRRDAAMRLLSAWPEFEAISVDSLETELRDVRAQLDAISTDELDGLETRLADLKAEKVKVSQEHTTAVADKARCEGSLETSTAKMAELAASLRASFERCGPMTADDRRNSRRRISDVMGFSEEQERKAFAELTRLKAVGLGDVWSAIGRQVGDQIGATERQLSTTESAMSDDARDYLRRFPEEESYVSSRLKGDTEEAEDRRREWIERLDRLRFHDLPACEAILAASEADYAIEGLGALVGQVESYRMRVEKMFKGLNSILESVPYDPARGTRARIRGHRAAQESVRRFRSMLEAASDTVRNGDVSQAAEEIEPILEMLRRTDSQRGEMIRKEVSDLRNWFSIDVEEYVVDENGEFLRQVRLFDGKDASSGGQAERLTMLLLGAGLSYTFGGHDEERKVSGLQTIVLDEAFLHGSEKTASASTDILAAMGLQVIAATPEARLSAFARQTETIFTVFAENGQSDFVPMTFVEAMAAANDGLISEEELAGL